MSLRWWMVVGLLLSAATAGATTEEPVKILRAYGPGGPHHVLQECAELFAEQHGVTVEVIKASPQELARKVPQDGDLYYGGAEYMLEDFTRQNPDVLDLLSVEKLHPRRIGVLVRKGNPLDIQGLDCLKQDHVDLMAVKLERMDAFHLPRHDRRSSVRHLVFSGQDGVEAWRTVPELDAWVTYKSWHLWLEEESDFIEISGDHALRFTPVAVTHRTPHRREALRFIAFLKSPAARRIFVEHGWE